MDFYAVLEQVLALQPIGGASVVKRPLPPFCGQDMSGRRIFSHEKLTAANIRCHASTHLSTLAVACTPARPTYPRTT
jgi:hypothetical protein